jgi:hypothetical protein
LPEGYVHQENVRILDGTEHKLVLDDNNLEDLENYGRMFIWFDFLDKQHHETLVETARKYKDMN